MPLKIIIVGAGIGGPTAAIALAKKGHQVTILERSKLEKEVGFAFRITPNSDRCLKYIGIDAEQGGAVAADSGRMMDGKTGKVWREFGENKENDKAGPGTSVFAFRPQLSRQLFDMCETLGVQIRVGVNIKAINPENTQVSLEDGTTLTADLIVGADGVNSVVRPYIANVATYHPMATLEQNCFRLTIPTAAFKTDELISQVYDEKFSLFSWKTGNLFMILYPVDFGKRYNVVCTHPARLSDSVVNNNSATEDVLTYNQSVSLDKALEIYKDFEPRAKRVFELADPNGFRIWKLKDMEELPTWSAHTTIVIGDAAHPVLPFGFSGASMAIEDGVFLAELLPEDIKQQEIAPRLQLFEKERKPRVRRVLETARMIGSGQNEAAVLGPYMKFLAEYDTAKAAREALAKHQL